MNDQDNDAINPYLMSGEMNPKSSVNNMMVMKLTQAMLTMAPLVVGWVRSLGILR